MSTGYSMEDDSDVDINSPVVMESLEDQETTDLLDKARKVHFEIKKATVRTQHIDPQNKSSEWIFKRLSLQVAVGSEGVDGEGASANRRLFPEFLLAFNREATQDLYDFDSEWYKKKARGPAKELFAALGFSLNPPPAVDHDFLEALAGREFIADITVKSVDKKTDKKNDKGKWIYEPTGDYRNELANFRSAE